MAASLSHFPIPHTIKHVSTGRGPSKVSPDVLLYGGASKVSPEVDQCALGFTVWCWRSHAVLTIKCVGLFSRILLHVYTFLFLSFKTRSLR